ncbi:MAG: hypothetical protein RLP44_27675 [Aggregatilineales bacterium]
MHRKILFMLMCCIVWGAISISLTAQQLPLFDRGHPLRQMLSFVPDNDQTREGLLGYIDYRAQESINGFTVNPANYSEFDNLSDYEQSLWIHRSRRWRTGPDFFQYLLAAGADTVDATGFDAFGVDRALVFGNPPTHGTILETDSDISAFETAHRARNYTQTEINGITAWCSEGGCDDGMQQDLRNRDVAYLFDPALGRRPPILVTDNYFASAFVLGVIEGMADAYNGTTESLAESVDYGAIVDAVLDPDHFSGDLMQLIFLAPTEFYTIDFTSPNPYAIISPSLDDIQTPLDSWADYGELPRWTLAALADRQDGDQISAVLTLVYSDQADAEQAATELGQRVLAFADELLRIRQPEPIISDITGGVTPEEPYVYETEDGYFVAVVGLTHPSPPEGAENIGMSSDNPAQTPGMLFARWVNAIYSRTFDVLWNIVPPEE